MSPHRLSIRALPIVLRAPGLEKRVSQEKHAILRLRERFVVSASRSGMGSARLFDTQALRALEIVVLARAPITGTALYRSRPRGGLRPWMGPTFTVILTP